MFPRTDVPFLQGYVAGAAAPAHPSPQVLGQQINISGPGNVTVVNNAPVIGPAPADEQKQMNK